MALAKIIDPPNMFLNKRFPKWREDNKTHMIPPIFIAKQSRHQIGIKESVSEYSNRGDQGECIVYNLLRQLGELENLGMFVIHGFELREIPRWNEKMHKSEKYLVPKFPSRTGECDFIIFYHKLGVISLEVKNELNVQDDRVLSAETQLKTSRDLITRFANPKVPVDEDQIHDSTTELPLYNAKDTPIHLPHRKVIALPSTKKSAFNIDEFTSLEPDTLLLFQDNTQDIESFQKWWKESIGDPSLAVQMTPKTQEAYELALSYILMIRHLGPVTEIDCISRLRQLLVTYKFHGKVDGKAVYPQVVDTEFPEFMSWCWDVLDKKDKKFDFGEGNPNELKKDFMKRHKLKEKGLKDRYGIMVLNELLKRSKYISGDKPSRIDDVIAAVFEDNFFLFFENILRFYNDVRKQWAQIEELRAGEHPAMVERYPFLKLESLKDLNRLDRHLSRCSFIEGDRLSEVDKQLFESLTCQLRVKHSLRPIVMTTEQLAVFEGPKKQLIVGPPGSGKTELLRFKAADLENKMRACKTGKRIMYILANGSPIYPERNSLFYYHIKEFFRKFPLVDVITIVLEDESSDDMKHTTSGIRRKIESGMYDHVFIDEYWIGSKPAEHKIILELITGIPGYVWISSVFNFRRDMMDKGHSKLSLCTKPLLTALKDNGGEVSNITQVARATNHVIDLERGYSKLYQVRSYPYGTETILGHSLEGLPVAWAVEDTVEAMYEKCANVVHDSLTNLITMSKENLVLDPADILIVNFAIRMSKSRSVKQSLEEYLQARKIPFWSFGERLEQKVDFGKVTLLQSFTRDASSFLDGVEWPLVVVILPSVLLLNTAELAEGAKSLRNYDPYISFFRAMVKLIVISDKWENNNAFLKDIEQKLENEKH